MKQAADDLQAANEQLAAAEEEMHAQFDSLAHVQNELIRSEEKLQGIFNNVNDAIHLHKVGLDGFPSHFIDVNDTACAMVGYSREEMLRRSPLDFVTGYHNRPLEEIIGELKTKGTSLFETEHRRKDGTIVPVEIHSHAITLQGENVILSVIRDITERKRADRAIQLTNKKLNLLSSVTRHDINNQLMVLKLSLEMIQTSLDDKEKVREYISRGELAADTIHRQISFTREYKDLGVSAPTWQDVRASVSHAAEELDLAGIRIDTRELQDIEIMADGMLGKAFFNLFDNALRHGGETMKDIRISSHDAGQGLVIVCEDDGKGIPGDEKARIFESGYGKNTGFGLFLIREVLGITGITIRETGTEGAGARFEILVPNGGYRAKESTVAATGGGRR